MDQKKFIFILGDHKSGTTLLRSLLDSHPEVSVSPVETHPFAHLGFPVNYSMRKQEKRDFGVEEIQENLINWINKLNRQADSLKGGNYAYQKIDVSHFEKRIREINTQKYADIISQYLHAVIEAIEGGNNKFYIAEKSVENFEFAETLSRYFPDSKFVHIIRNPYSNVASIRKYKLHGSGRIPSYRRILKSIQQSEYYLERNSLSIDNYLKVKYEKLANDPEKMMHKIAGFLDISFDDILLRPTVLGELWEGNSVTDKKFSSIEQTYTEKEIYQLEILLVNRFLNKILQRFDYNQLSANRIKAFLPLKKESRKIYLVNRSLLFSRIDY